MPRPRTGTNHNTVLIGLRIKRDDEKLLREFASRDGRTRQSMLRWILGRFFAANASEEEMKPEEHPHEYRQGL